MIEGSPEFQKRSILNEYDDIFSYNVKGKAMYPMTFAVDNVGCWKTCGLEQMIDDLLDLQVIYSHHGLRHGRMYIL